MMRWLALASIAAACSTIACGQAPDATRCNQTSDCTGDAVCTQNLCQAGYRLSMTPTGDGAGRITSSPDGFNCSVACSAPLAAGAALTLHAIPDSNSDFLGWSGGCSGTGDCPVTMDAAKSVTALFRSNHVVFASEMKLDGSDAPNANSTFNVWRVSADGTGLTPLTRATASGANSASARSSPDGKQVSFVSALALDGSDAANTNSIANIWRINADGTGLTPLTRAIASNDGILSISSAQWSPDGTKLVFSSARNVDGSDSPNPSGISNVWRVNADGTGLIALTQATVAGASSFNPQWSPDGTKIAFSSSLNVDGTNTANPNGTSNIWVMDASGGGRTPLTRATAASAGSSIPEWSPDGTKLVFSSSRNTNLSDTSVPAQNIWRVNVDGGGLTPVTINTVAGADSTFARFSPNGRTIVFSSSMRLDGSNAANVNNTANVWRIDADGANLTALTRATASADGTFMFPGFSLEGSRIIFSSSNKLDGTDAANANSTTNIWRLNVNGGTKTALTRATANGASSLTCATGGGTELWILELALAVGFLRRRSRRS